MPPGNSLRHPSSTLITATRNFSSRPSGLDNDFQAPEAIDYRYVAASSCYFDQKWRVVLSFS